MLSSDPLAVSSVETNLPIQKGLLYSRLYQGRLHTLPRGPVQFFSGLHFAPGYKVQPAQHQNGSQHTGDEADSSAPVQFRLQAGVQNNYAGQELYVACTGREALPAQIDYIPQKDEPKCS